MCTRDAHRCCAFEAGCIIAGL
jgi:hypothetical protein